MADVLEAEVIEASEQTVVQRLNRDLANAAKTLSKAEARFLVDYYYIKQEDRKRSDNQVRALNSSNEPHTVVKWLATQSAVLENQIKRALGLYSMEDSLGKWAQSNVGIGPVIAAGLLAYIDIEKAPTVGHIWRFAGLDPTSKWMSSDDAKAWVKANGVNVELAAKTFGRQPASLQRMATTSLNKDTKQFETVELTATTLAKALARRPWNAGFKVLCWKIGESFVKFKNKEGCYYGKVYTERRAFEDLNNARGAYAAQAAALLKAKPTHKQAPIYKEGKLPDGHLHARSKRYAVKLFLAHYHEAAYRLVLKKAPPLPYAIAHLGHAHKKEVPGLDVGLDGDDE